MRISSSRLGCRAHHSTHEGLIFVRHDISSLIDDSCSSDGAACLHIYGVTCYAYQGSGRSCLHVDICSHRLVISQNGRPYAVGRINGSAVCIEIDHDKISSCLVGLLKAKGYQTLGRLVYITVKSDAVYYSKGISSKNADLDQNQGNNQCKPFHHMFQ